MDRDLSRFEAPFDVLVIGGGINGTGVARDAARRGLKVALVEKEDFGYGTTGRSTRLIHGGLRYLEHYDFGLVRESLRERRLLIENAPHLVRPLRFLFPVYKGVVSKSKARLGLTFYDRLAGTNMPSHRWLDHDEVVAEEPGLLSDDLLGAFEYHDAQIAAVERLCVENALDAAEHGAVVANHVRVTGFAMENGGVVGAQCEDMLTGATFTVRAAVTFNATGPWLADLDVPRATPDAPPRLRMTKGIHLVVPSCVTTSLILRAPDDGRTFFAIPWFGRTLVGTTDTDYGGDLDGVAADRDDVDYLVEATRHFLPRADLDTIDYTTAGVRSLLNEAGVDEGAVSRKHDILDHEKIDGVAGIVSLVGGKITPFRGVCEEVTDVLARRLGHKKLKGDTKHAPLPGGGFTTLPELETEAVAAAEPLGVPAQRARHLAGLYGARYRDVLALVADDAALARPLCEHGDTIAAEVVHAVKRETALTPGDVLLRRTMAGWMPCEGADHALDACLDVMQAHFGWDDATRAQQAAGYRAEIASRSRYRGAESSVAASPERAGADASV